jgi:hypothetical protein
MAKTILRRYSQVTACESVGLKMKTQINRLASVSVARGVR